MKIRTKNIRLNRPRTLVRRVLVAGVDADAAADAPASCISVGNMFVVEGVGVVSGDWDGTFGEFDADGEWGHGLAWVDPDCRVCSAVVMRPLVQDSVVDSSVHVDADDDDDDDDTELPEVVEHASTSMKNLAGDDNTRFIAGFLSVCDGCPKSLFTELRRDWGKKNVAADHVWTRCSLLPPFALGGEVEARTSNCLDK